VELLLTSSGIANTSIHDALLGLLGKPIEESSALVIPTAIYPFPGGAGHADHQDMAIAEQWAARIPAPTYAIDDQTAIKVTDGNVEVVSEGHWRLFTP
jgi:hypothetical protein